MPHSCSVALQLLRPGQVHTLKVYDESSERKTAANLLKLMLEVKKIAEEEWGVIVVAFTTDASGESRSARKQLVALFHHLIGPDCYGHQVGSDMTCVA